MKRVFTVLKKVLRPSSLTAGGLVQPLTPPPLPPHSAAFRSKGPSKYKSKEKKSMKSAFECPLCTQKGVSTGAIANHLNDKHPEHWENCNFPCPKDACKMRFPDETDYTAYKESKKCRLCRYRTARECKEEEGKKFGKPPSYHTMAGESENFSKYGFKTRLTICEGGDDVKSDGNNRDRRCGVCGPILIEKFKEEVESKGLKKQVSVAACSHVGQRKYAGNTIIFSPDPEGKIVGNWYGYVTPSEAVELLDKQTGKGEVFDRIWSSTIAEESDLPPKMLADALNVKTHLTICEGGDDVKSDGNNRDWRCGVCGPILIEKFKEEVESKGLKKQVSVAACSHVGQPKYAGNMIIFSPNPEGKIVGNWYGYVTPSEAVELLDKQTGKGEVFDRIWSNRPSSFTIAEESDLPPKMLADALNVKTCLTICEGGDDVKLSGGNNCDQRYGVCGPILIEKFKEEVESRGLKNQVSVPACSHAGQHKYAGNMIIFSPNPEGKIVGNWYGYVTPSEVVELLDKQIGKGEVIDWIWSSTIAEESDLLPKMLADAFNVKTRLTICEGGDDVKLSDGYILICPEMILYRGLKDADVDSFIEDVLANGKHWASGVLEDLTRSYVFVCAHNNRDRRCVVCGPGLIEKFKEEIEDKGLKNQASLTSCPHVGKHNYAGNTIIFSLNPEGKSAGNWYGYFTPNDVGQLLDKQIGKGEVINLIWRGQMGAYVKENEPKLANGTNVNNKEKQLQDVVTKEKLESVAGLCQGANGPNEFTCCRDENVQEKPVKKGAGGGPTCCIGK